MPGAPLDEVAGEGRHDGVVDVAGEDHRAGFRIRTPTRAESPRTPGGPFRIVLGGWGRWSRWVVGGPACGSLGTGVRRLAPLVAVGGQVGGGRGVEVGCGAVGRFGGMAG